MDRQFATLLPLLVCTNGYVFVYDFVFCFLNIVCLVSLRIVYFSLQIGFVSEQGSAPAPRKL